MPEPAETGESVRLSHEAARVKGHLWCRPQPQIPIQVRWRISVRRISNPFRVTVAVVPGADEAHLSDGTISNQVYGFLKMEPGSLLSTHLNDALVAACCLHHTPAFFEVHRNRLLHVNIFAGLAGENGVQGM